MNRDRSRVLAPRFAALAVAAGVLVLGGCARPVTAAAPASVAPVGNDLYSADAGFARQTSIAVQSVADPNVATAVGWWNAEAGRPLFVLTTFGHPQVTIQTDNGTCADAPIVACTAAFSAAGSFTPPAAYPYNSCAIYMKPLVPTDWRVYAHELGHCLGFDHVHGRASIMNPAPDPSDPTGDRTMLRLAGYVDGGSQG